MKKLIFILVIMASLLAGSVHADECKYMSGEDFFVKKRNAHYINKRFTLIGIMLEDIQWRFPDLRFVETHGIVEVGSSYEDRSLIKVFTLQNKLVYTHMGVTFSMASPSNRLNDLEIFRSLVLDRGTYGNMPFIVPAIIKSTLDFSCFPLGYTILNPDNGLIEERWDGSKWLKPTEKSTINFNQYIDPGTSN